jgi:hypothetical protein
MGGGIPGNDVIIKIILIIKIRLTVVRRIFFRIDVGVRNIILWIQEIS